MDKSITKNIIIGILGILLGLSLCYIGYDKLIKKENIKEGNNENQEENNFPSSSDTEENCGSKCYGGISTNGLNVIKWFYNNNKLLDVFQLNVSSFDIEKATVDDYFAFIIGYTGGDDITETDLKNGLMKYFEIKDIDKVMEQLKQYKVSEDSFIKSFTYKDNKFSLEHKVFVEYDYNYKVIDYKENKNSNEISLNILKCDSYDEMNCSDGKVLTLSNTNNGFKIKKLENY